jgi:hypothetical protein
VAPPAPAAPTRADPWFDNGNVPWQHRAWRGHPAGENGVSGGEDRAEAMRFTGVKVFSATKAKDREELGESITRWLRSNADLEVVDRVVSQSSDNEFHCLSIVLFYRARQG